MEEKYFGRETVKMKNIIIYCEGQTEESFVNSILYPYFAGMDIYVTPVIHKTKRTPTKSFKGGVKSYYPIKEELIKLCQNPNLIVTTMFDYYGMPGDTPSIDYKNSDIYNRVEYIEKAINEDIGYSNLMFNILIHEFEGLLFSNPQSFSIITDGTKVSKLQAVKDNAETPEHINNSYETTPSRRIKSIINDYSKVRQGTIVAKHIGIDKMLSECKHFEQWINKIQNTSQYS